MLDVETFKTITKNTPLISIDLCLVHSGKILLGKRNNEPLKGEWFTPGGRVLKNESWKDCLVRVGKTELGLEIYDLDQFILMGIWDHFYSNSIFGDDITTHYVNLPHYIFLKEMPALKVDSQHDRIEWFDIAKLANNSNFHNNVRNYASWLNKLGVQK